MLNTNRRLIQAKEESVKALRRSAAAKQRIAEALRDMLNEEDDEPAKPPPLPKKANDSAKRSPRQK